MKRLNFRNCILAGCSVSCLSVIAITIIIVLSIRNFRSNDWLKNFKITHRSHLSAQNKEISLKIGLVSDSENDWEYLRKALSELRNLGITNVIHLGDITHLGTEEDLYLAKDTFDEFELNVYPVPGDRDLWKSRGVGGFQNVFGTDYRTLALSGFSFLLIDNSNEYEGIGPDQWQFIIDSLSGADFVFLHNPIYFGSIPFRMLGNKGMGEYSIEVNKQREELLGLIRESNVKAVFAGDQHLFSENRDDSDSKLMHYVIGAINSVRNLQRPNIAVLTVYADGDFYVERIVF